MAKRRRQSFWASLPGILTGLGTLVAACVGLIALFVHTSGRDSSPSSNVNTTATVTPTGRDETGGTSSRATSSVGSTVGSNIGSNVGSSVGSTVSPTVSQTVSPTVSTGPTISGVSFTGNTAAPTVIVTGNGFGSTSPAGQPDNSTSCGAYTNNGDDYGPTNLGFLDVGNFEAGNGTPPNGSCIGIIVVSWSSNQVKYQFGNAYNSFDHWYMSAGDQYTLWVKGLQYSGTVNFST